MLFFQRRLEASVIKPHSPRFQPLPNDLSVRNIVWLWGAEPGGTPGAPVSLGVQVTAGLTGCFVVCDYWKPTLTISENGRRVLEPSSIFYGHDLQSQQSSSTCKMCLCVCTCSVCMCVCVYAREHVQCWGWTQGLTHPKQALYHWAPSPALSRQDLIKLCWLVLKFTLQPKQA